MMAFRNLAAPWHEELLAVDASAWGVGVVSQQVTPAIARPWTILGAAAALPGGRGKTGPSDFGARPTGSHVGASGGKRQK